MGFAYLNQKNWSDITREERFFCAHLYFELLKNITPFLKLLAGNKIIKETLAVENLWEIGFEVCFYRDFIYKIGFNGQHEIGKTPYHHLGKRTFDLCLFSEKQIIIIEAKAQQGFDTKQLESFKSDIETVRQLLGENIDIKLIGLVAARYRPKEETKKNFASIFNWQQLYECYKNDLFLKAEDTFRN